jgi:hypothetical protein
MEVKNFVTPAQFTVTEEGNIHAPVNSAFSVSMPVQTTIVTSSFIEEETTSSVPNALDDEVDKQVDAEIASYYSFLETHK